MKVGSIMTTTELEFTCHVLQDGLILHLQFSFILQPNTRLRITGISGYEEYPADPILDPAAA